MATLDTSQSKVSAAAPPREAAPLAPVSDKPANLKGSVLIVEYHHLGTSKNTMFRSPVQFQHDLERLYDLGFRPVGLSDYLENRMKLAPGASPVVMTFDDSNPDQVRFDAAGHLEQSCFLGIWQSFAAKHPDFPIKATFFVLPTMWGQPKMVTKKLELLNSLGCEIGNHTITHPILRKLNDQAVEKEIGEAEDRIATLGEPTPSVLALPFGSSPKNAGLLRGFDYQGKHYAPKAVMLVGANPAPAPDSKKFDKYRVPRVQACEGPFGLTYWLDKMEKGDTSTYVAGK